MDLDKYLEPEIKVGQQVLEVKEVRRTTTHTGSKLIRIRLESKEGGELIQNFQCSKKGMRYLASFAIACGLSKDDLKHFQPEDLVGKTVCGNVVVNEAGFHCLNAWWEVPVEEDYEDGF